MISPLERAQAERDRLHRRVMSMETDAPELPAVKTCLFHSDELVAFRKVMKGEE